MQKSKMPPDRARRQKQAARTWISSRIDALGIEPVGPWQNQIDPRSLRSPGETWMKHDVSEEKQGETIAMLKQEQKKLLEKKEKLEGEKKKLLQEAHQKAHQKIMSSTEDFCLFSSSEDYEEFESQREHGYPYADSSKEKAQQADDKEKAQQAERKRTEENQVEDRYSVAVAPASSDESEKAYEADESMEASSQPDQGHGPAKACRLWPYAKSLVLSPLEQKWKDDEEAEEASYTAAPASSAEIERSFSQTMRGLRKPVTERKPVTK